MRLFQNRAQAARELGEHLAYLKSQRPIVIAISNGGIPVAAALAEMLDAPLDILLIRKLAAPKQPQHVVGAVDEHGRISMLQRTARWHHLTSQLMIGPAREVFTSLQARRARFREALPELDVRGRSVLIVDHGVATGASMMAAIVSVRDRGAAKIIAAAPAGNPECLWQLHEAAHSVVIPHTPPAFRGIEQYYREYDEISDDLAIAMLMRWSLKRAAEDTGVKMIPLRLLTDQQRVLYCELDLPPEAARGSGPYPAVVFAHGFESDARSPRSVPISRRLAKRGIIGVRMDFTGHGRSEGAPGDATPARMVDDLKCVIENIRLLDEVDSGRVGLNGAGTGGMIALDVAADDRQLKALVIRGPISGGEFHAVSKVTAPALLIHAEHDKALAATVDSIDHDLAATHQVLRIPDSSRLFGDPISLELMVGATVQWFIDHLRPDHPAPKSGAAGSSLMEHVADAGARV